MDNYDANANVVLNADVSGYTNSLQAASKETNSFIGLVDKVVSRLDGMSKRAGKRITLFSAADLAAMTGFAAVAANYEKQLSTINVTLGKGQDNIQKYSKGINELTRTTSKSRGEIVALTAQIRQMGISSQAENQKLASTFLNLSKATNASLPAVTGQMIEFSRQMGMMGSAGAGSMQKLSDSLVTVSQSTGTSAEGILSFSQAIAPISKVAGLTSKDVLGISAAFNRAGADGFAAGNTFNTMVADIARSTRNGSPELLKYANLIGKSLDEFKNLDPAEQLVQIFESINKAGPDAVNILDQLGFDGIRAAKSIQAVASEAGGLRAAVSDANSGYGSGATKEAADRGKTYQDTLSKAKNSVEQLASAIGEGALPPMTLLVGVAQQFVDKITPVVEPFAKIAGFVSTIVGGLGMAAGPLVSSLGMFSKIGMAGWAIRSARNSSLFGGARDARTGEPSKMMDQYTSGNMSPMKSRMYEAGLAIGNRAGGEGSGVAGRIAGAAASSPFVAARWYGNWTKNFYKEAGGFGKGDPANEAGTFTSDYRTYRDDRKKRFRTAHSAGQAAVEGLDAGAGATAKRMAYFNAFNGSLKESATTAMRSSSALNKFTVNVITSTAALGKMSAYNVAQGTRNIEAAGGSLLSRGASSALGMVGGPMGAAALGGMALYTGVNDSKQAQEDTYKKLEATTSRYDAALGTATASVTTFSDALKTASSKAVDKGQTSKDVMGKTVDNGEVASANASDYKDSKVGGLTSKQGALGYLQSLGKLDTEHAVAVRQDFVKKFGKDADSIFAAYNGGNTGDNREYSGAIPNLLNEAAQAQAKEAGSGWNPINTFNRLAIDPGQQANDMINQAWMAGQQRSSSFGQMYNSDVANKATQASILDYAKGANQAGDRFSDPNTRDVFRTGAAKQLEQFSLFSDGKGKEFMDAMGDNNNNVTKAVQVFLDNNKDNPKRKDFEEFFKGADDNYNQKLSEMANDKSKLSEAELKFRETNQGGFMESNSRVREATNMSGSKTQDPNEVTGAISALTANALSLGKGNISGAIGQNISAMADQDPNGTRVSALNASIQELLKINQQRSNGMGRAEKWQNQAGIADQFASVPGSNQNADAYHKQAVDMYRDVQSSFSEFVKSMAMAQKQYDLSQKRQREDFNLQNKYAYEDFYRQQKNSNADFLRARNNQQADYDKQMRRQIEDSAKTMYDPYERVQAQYTSDVGTILSNFKDQADELKSQVKNLAKVKKMGLDQSVIDMLSLADPSKAQQLDRLVSDLQDDPSSINKLNKQTKGRLKDTGKLVKNDANSSYRRQEEDRATSLKRQQEEFDISMKRGAESFERSMDRSNKAMAKSIHRSKEDFVHMYDEITGLSKDNYTHAVSWLTKTLGPAMSKNIIAQMKTTATKVKNIFGDILPPGYSLVDGKVVEQGTKGNNAWTTPDGKSKVKQNSWTAEDGRSKVHNAAGGIATRNTDTRIAEAGPEAVIPLNTSGEIFMANMMKRATAEVVKGMITSGHRSPVTGSGHTNITANTSNFHVEKIVAQDPNEMARKLKEKERVQALRRPVSKK